MAEALSCPVCLDVLKEPVTIPCGHSYCMNCLQSHWDQQTTYTCPECRRSFSQRPVLGKNIMLAALVEQLQRTAPPACDHRSRRAELQTERARLLQSLRDKESDLEKLQQEAQDLSHSAQTALRRSADMFRGVTLLLQKRHAQVEQQIRSELQTRLGQVQEAQGQLQRDITELKGSMAKLEGPVYTPKQDQVKLRCPLVSIDTPGTERMDFEFVTRAVSDLRDKLQLILGEFEVSYPASHPEDASLLPAEPITRDDFLKYSRDITLDPNTAFAHLCLSDGDRTVTYSSEAQAYREHRERFSVWSQVLSREELSGRSYFEVEWSVRDMVRVAVAYRDIGRKGYSDECGFGNNPKSWALQRMKNMLSFLFDGVQSALSGPVQSRIGVFVDQGGSLSFYSVQDQTMSLLHRVQASFTQPLYVGVLIVWERNTVSFPKLS